MSEEVRHVTARLTLLPTRIRSDGYRPLTYAVMAWGNFHDQLHDERFWYFSSLARRLDFAHIQFERVRSGIDALQVQLDYELETAMEVLADAEAAVTALHTAIKMSRSLEEEFGGTPFLETVSTAQCQAIRQLRNSYEHVDARAMGQIDPSKSVDLTTAHSLFFSADFGRQLVEGRRLSYGEWTFEIDGEASAVCVSLRSYVMGAWQALTRK